MLDLLRRDGDSSNTIIGIVLLVMLLVFVGPDVLPRLLSRSFPFIDEGVPCAQLRTASDRSRHQSLIGRSTQNPLELTTQIDPLPLEDTGTWTVRIMIVNTTIGTVPFVFNENQVIIGDNGTSGIGLIFNPVATFNLGTNRAAIPANSPVAPQNIRLLGPRQRCVHRVEIPANQVAPLRGGGYSVRSYYRITTPGPLPSQANAIFVDQGLAIINGGYVESQEVPIPAALPSNDAP